MGDAFLRYPLLFPDLQSDIRFQRTSNIRTIELGASSNICWVGCEDHLASLVGYPYHLILDGLEIDASHICELKKEADQRLLRTTLDAACHCVGQIILEMGVEEELLRK